MPVLNARLLLSMLDAHPGCSLAFQNARYLFGVLDDKLVCVEINVWIVKNGTKPADHWKHDQLITITKQLDPNITNIRKGH
uniref:DUF362 domain-containing protein n=1 Tax=Steinernema glaseri TaxID=37863 RepID=A0A1I7Z7Q0_9BILA